MYLDVSHGRPASSGDEDVVEDWVSYRWSIKPVNKTRVPNLTTYDNRGGWAWTYESDNLHMSQTISDSPSTSSAIDATYPYNWSTSSRPACSEGLLYQKLRGLSFY